MVRTDVPCKSWVFSYGFHSLLLLLLDKIDIYNREATLKLESLWNFYSRIFFRVFIRGFFIVILYTLKFLCCPSIPPRKKSNPLKFSYAFHTISSTSMQNKPMYRQDQVPPKPNFLCLSCKLPKLSIQFYHVVNIYSPQPHPKVNQKITH